MSDQEAGHNRQPVHDNQVAQQREAQHNPGNQHRRQENRIQRIPPAEPVTAQRISCGHAQQQRQQITEQRDDNRGLKGLHKGTDLEDIPVPFQRKALRGEFQDRARLKGSHRNNDQRTQQKDKDQQRVQ
ncbi:hypothetical protein D3C73_1126400 [compost metagenome]